MARAVRSGSGQARHSDYLTESCEIASYEAFLVGAGKPDPTPEPTLEEITNSLTRQATMIFLACSADCRRQGMPWELEDSAK